MKTCTFSPGNVQHFWVTCHPPIRVNPRYYIPKFCAFCNFTHICRCSQNVHKKRFPRFYTNLCDPHTDTKWELYCIHKNKKDYKHTSYPTHLKLIVKNKDHAYAEQLIPNGQCVVTLYISVFKLTDNACTHSMMDDRRANFGAAHYTVKYSDFTLDDKLLYLMGKMNNAVPLILNPFHLKGKMLCHIGHLNWTVLQLQHKPGI